MPEDRDRRERCEPGGERALPPGQEPRAELPVMHYGPVPKVRDPDQWWMRFWGRLAGGVEGRREITLAETRSFPRVRVEADLHCGQGWSVLGNVWEGFAARDLVEAFPPADDVCEVLVYAEYGYSANVSLEDLCSPRAVVTTHLDGAPLTPEHGFPVRLVLPHLYSWKGPKWFRGWEYLDEPRRGFWEERGYHLHGDPWTEQRYSYQET